MTTAAQLRQYEGAPIFAMGFRPFFLFGAIYAALALPLWIVGYHGWITGVTRDWHVHEMLFGYLGAVIAGFLLTAVPNWTGRLPVSGGPLAMLFSLWAAGRVAMLINVASLWAAIIDSGFLFALAFIIGREVIAGRNVRNLGVCVLVLLLAGANLLTHLRGWDPGIGLLGERFALAAIGSLLTLIGGRIVPSFTRNWMAKQGMKDAPVAANRFDLCVLVMTGASFAAWVFAPYAAATGVILLGAGALNFIRLARWRGWRTHAEILVLILHVGYLWLAIALSLLGASILFPASVPAISGIHALTAGAFGVMTLAVMTRASRGHTGQPLTADRGTQWIYALVTIGAALRVAGPFFGAINFVFVIVSAVLWSAAFAAFAFLYGPLLVSVRHRA
ncbi:MAG: NnrS family protein [Terricaulis sp.]